MASVGLHHRGGGRGGAAAPIVTPASPPGAPSNAPVLRRRGPQVPRASTAPSRSTRTACRPDRARRQAAGGRQRARSTRPAADRPARGLARPARNVVNEGRKVETFRLRAGSGRCTGRRRAGRGHGQVEARGHPLRAGRDGPSTARASPGRAGHRRSQLVKPGDLVETSASRALTTRRTSDRDARAAAARRRAPCSPSTTAPGASRRWWAGLQLRTQQVQPRHAGLRQVGSTFKPFVYTAAIDRGYTPASCCSTRRTTFPGRPGPAALLAQQLRPTVRGPDHAAPALEQSRNIPAVRLMDSSARGRSSGTRAARVRVADAALSLGRARRGRSDAARDDERLLGLSRTRACACAVPILKVTDREGNVLEENRPEPHDAIRADTAFVVTNLLRASCSAARPRGPRAQLAARRQDRHDRRLHRRLVHRLRSRHHRRRLGRPRREEADRPNQTGGVAALPIWMEIMRAWIGDRTDPPEFEPPGNIVFQRGPRHLEVGRAGRSTEVFIAGTQPGAGFRLPSTSRYAG
jgi:hypothetical protein